jgi:phosphate acetyltransferase
MVVPPFRGGEKEEVLTFADCGVVKHPTAEQLADIAIAAADARVFVVGDEPRVALLSYSTKGSGGDNGVSIPLVREAGAIVRAKRPDIKIEDELQADAALIEAISERKVGRKNAIGHGKANVLVFPSLDAGNIAYKLVERLVPGAKAIGPIGQGFAKPINDLSRGASVEDIVHSALIAAAQAKKDRV